MDRLFHQELPDEAQGREDMASSIQVKDLAALGISRI